MSLKKWKIDPISLFSHELKTPLSSLKLALGLLEKDFENNKDMIPLMKKELEGMITLVTDLLDLRHIQQKKDLMLREWKSFDSVLSEACSSLKLLADRNELSFSVSKTEDFELFMDPLWMLCLLKNLLSNALKYAPKKTSILIEYGESDGKDPGFFCSIQDEGPGFSDVKKIFNPFYKGPQSSKKSFHKSTGLGLSIAKSILEAHGGSIEAFSKNPGALIQFQFPRARRLKKSA